MPGKLMVVVGLMALGVVLNLAGGGLVAAAIGAALIIGVLAGNDGVRTFLRGLAAIQIAWALAVLGMASDIVAAPALLVAGIIGIGTPAFLIWALGQNDVREWMFRKNFNLDDDNAPPPSL
jgi:hypothetical protein